MSWLDRQQRGVARAMLAAVAVTVTVLVAATFLPPPALRPASTGDAIRWLALLPVPLMIAIAALARHRFFSPQDIDGSAGVRGTPAALRLQSILQNTLEQTVLAALVDLAWIHLAPGEALGAVPAAIALFLIGRFLFARGDASGAQARAFGFALTFYPTVLLALANAVLLILARAGGS